VYKDQEIQIFEGAGGYVAIFGGRFSLGHGSVTGQATATFVIIHLGSDYVEW
jgi:hypothetical protein